MSTAEREAMEEMLRDNEEANPSATLEEALEAAWVAGQRYGMASKEET